MFSLSSSRFKNYSLQLHSVKKSSSLEFRILEFFTLVSCVKRLLAGSSGVNERVNNAQFHHEALAIGCTYAVRATLRFAQLATRLYAEGMASPAMHFSPVADQFVMPIDVIATHLAVIDMCMFVGLYVLVGLAGRAGKSEFSIKI